MDAAEPAEGSPLLEPRRQRRVARGADLAAAVRVAGFAMICFGLAPIGFAIVLYLLAAALADFPVLLYVLGLVPVVGAVCALVLGWRRRKRGLLGAGAVLALSYAEITVCALAAGGTPHVKAETVVVALYLQVAAGALGLALWLLATAAGAVLTQRKRKRTASAAIETPRHHRAPPISPLWRE